MTTYKLIIKNKIKTDINFFSLDYKEDPYIKWYIKVSFMVMLNQKLDIKNKYKTFFELLNGFLIKDHKDEFICYFSKIQKNYNILNRLIYNYKYKKAKIVVNSDMCLNELTENQKNVLCILDNNSKYLFNINDLIKIIDTSLTNSDLFFAQPKSIKNPYNNLSFNKSTLYNIYFFIIYKTNYYPELLFKFFKCHFNLTNFKYLNEHLLRDYSIENYVYKTPYNTIKDEIILMVNFFNSYCQQIKNKILINEDFPQKKIVEIMRPYLFLYCKSQYSFHPEEKRRYYCYFKESLIRFNKFNPQFGRKKIKLLYKVNSNFKKKISEKEIYFDDNCIKFLNVEKLNDNFLVDHLKYTDIIIFTSNNFINNNGVNDEDIYNIDYIDNDDELDDESDLLS
jgi:hypothetical protein